MKITYSKKKYWLIISSLLCLQLILVQLASAQTVATVKGLVTDESSLGIPGATITMKNVKTNATLKAQSDNEGVFQFKVPGSGVYSFSVSSIGYQTQTLSGYNIKPGENISLSIKLLEEKTTLNDIVVIGYGQQSKSKVVGAVGSIDGTQLQKTASVSADVQLAGKMSGVVINQANGQPGAGAQIIIRGTGTLTAGGNPLIVVDGFPLTEGTSLNALNPNDIESIDVLKDAASAAIYGSRAANGVLLITTKKGKLNKPFSVDLNIYGGFQQQSSGVKLVDGYQFAQFLSEARNWGYVSKDPTNRNESDPNPVRVTKKIGGKSIDGRELILEDLVPYLQGKPGLTNTDWMDEGFRNAAMYNYDLAFYGGNDKTKYYTSIGYLTQDGIIIGTDLKRYSASFSLETQITGRFKVGVNIKPSYTNQNLGEQESRSSGVLGLMNLSFPFYKPYNADGSFNISDQLRNETRLVEGVNINGTPVENLVATALKVKNNRLRFKTFGNVYADAELIKGLTYNLSLGGDYDAYTNNYYYPSDVGAYRIPAPRTDADGYQTRQNIANYLLENTLTYKKEISNHNFSLLAGHAFQKQQSDYIKVTGTGFPDNNIQNIAGASAFSASPNQYTWTLESYLSRFQYDYSAKYLFAASFRTDGSSRFGANNKWGFFPSLSAGWVISKENFFPKSSVLSFAKIATSWGKTGNNQIGNYGSQALVTASNYIYGSALAPGYISTTAPNSNLGWEKASSLNIGLDLGLLQNKLNISAAYYRTITKDLLLDVPVPQQTGYNTVLANIGKMQNKGFEFQATASRLQIGSVNLGVNANITTYNNKVLALGPGQTQIAKGTDQNFVTKVGHPIGEIYGYNITGIYKTQAEIDNSTHIDGTLTGDYIVQDVNGDGKIDVEDKIAKGTYAPSMTYGFGSDVAYKGFTFSFSFMGVSGRTVLDGDMSSLTEAGEGFAVPSTYYFENRYHPTNNPNGFLGQPNFGNFSNARKLTRSSIVVQKNNGNYIRLRDVRLSYDFSPQLLKKLKLSQFQIYVSGNNVFTATKFRGWNPDGTSDDILTSGFNNGSNYPIAKTYLLGIRMSY